MNPRFSKSGPKTCPASVNFLYIFQHHEKPDEIENFYRIVGNPPLPHRVRYCAITNYSPVSFASKTLIHNILFSN